jgi:hypothetical protein
VKLALLACAALLLGGCTDSRWDREFELGENDFDAEAMEMIQTDTGLTLPAGTRGLNFRYWPPIDPSFVARLEIPANYLGELMSQIRSMKDDDPNGFRRLNRRYEISNRLHEKVSWWDPPKEGAQADNDRYRGVTYVRAVLTREGNRHILYLYYAAF